MSQLKQQAKEALEYNKAISGGKRIVSSVASHSDNPDLDQSSPYFMAMDKEEIEKAEKEQEKRENDEDMS